MRIALFATSLGDTLFPEAPKATVAVLERPGHEVVFPRPRVFELSESLAAKLGLEEVIIEEEKR